MDPRSATTSSPVGAAAAGGRSSTTGAFRAPDPDTTPDATRGGAHRPDRAAGEVPGAVGVAAAGGVTASGAAAAGEVPAEGAAAASGETAS